MFDQVGWGEMSVLLLLALFVFGPERLPSLAADLGRLVRQGRTWFRSITHEVTQDLGPELGDLGNELRELRPTSMAARLWDDDDHPPPVG